MDLEQAYALRPRGKATFAERDAGESSVMSIDTIKLDFMGIRETQQQQNFGF